IVAAVLMISSDALITSSAIDTTMMPMTCSGTRPAVSVGSGGGGGIEPGGLSSAPAISLGAVWVIVWVAKGYGRNFPNVCTHFRVPPSAFFPREPTGCGAGFYGR